MTGRYARRTIPLKIRGLATEKYIGHPLPEPIQEYESDENINELSPSELHPTHDAESASAEERCSSPSSCAQNQCVPLAGDGANTYRHFTGSATERSSLYSFGDDEFDRQSTLSIQKLFEDLELILFESQTIGPAHLRNECSIWTSEFLHLRILGTVKIPQQDLGYQFFEYKEESDVTPRSADVSDNGDELVVRGSHAHIKNLNGGILSGESDFDFLEGVEELMVQEGCVEEILAIDTQTGGEGKDFLWRDILQNLFNEMWADVIAGLEELLSRRLHQCFFLPPHGSHAVPFALDLYQNSQEASCHDFFLTRDSTSLSAMRPVASDRTAAAADRISRQLSVIGSDDRKLEAVLKISSKTLQARDKNFNHDSSLDLDVTRPSSGYLPMSGRNYCPRSDHITSARSRALGGRPKLFPISGNDQFKTFGMEDDRRSVLSHEVIRGYKMTTLNDRYSLVSSSVPTSIPRPAGPLPPISRDVNSSSGNSNNNNVSRKRGQLRVRSAVPNKAPNVHDRGEKAWTSSDYLRPHYAVHTLATAEQPHVFGANRRSSTTLGFNNMSGNHSNLAETVAGVPGKSYRKLSILGNRIPESEPNGEDESVNDVLQLSTKLAHSNKRFLHNNAVRHNDGFGRRAGHPHHQLNTAIR